MFIRKLGIALFCFIVSNLATAVEVQQGVIYQSGTQIESSQLGAAFTIPQGWQGAWPNDSEFFVLESKNLQASLFMLFDSIGKQQLIQLMAQPIPLDTTVMLQPLSQPVNNTPLVEAHYSVTGVPQIDKAYVAGRELRSGLSVAIIALAQSANRTQVNQVTSQIVKTMESRTPKQAPAAANSASNQSWQEYMRGRYIARYYSGSNYHEKEELWLCSDGTFYSSFGSGGFSMNGASGASQDSGRGNWRAEGNLGGPGTLILQFGAGKVVQGQTPGYDWTETSAGGERWTYQLALADKLYLNDQQWLRGNNDYCQ